MFSLKIVVNIGDRTVLDCHWKRSDLNATLGEIRQRFGSIARVELTIYPEDGFGNAMGLPLQPATDQRRPATAEDATGDEYEDQ